METIKVSKRNFKKIIEKAKKAIEEGKVLVFPTDTVYGLICDAKNEKAIKKIFEIKKRKIEKVLPIFVKDLKMANSIAEIEKFQENFLKKIWPGKITVILRSKEKFPKGILKNGKIGIRIPKYKFLNKILKALNRPLAQTSANVSGKKVARNVKGILRQFKDLKPDLIFDAGNLKPSLPSTVVDLTKKEPKILRKGAGKIKI